MKNTKFEVWFANTNYSPQLVIVHALCADDAIILAKAERIKEGLDHLVHKVEAK